jgi:hypothetical protein
MRTVRSLSKSVQRQLRTAIDLYSRFRNQPARKVAHVELSVPEVVLVVGHLEYVGYRTTDGRELKLYQHDFAPGSRPILAVSADGKQLVLLGGRYQFTHRGIVDHDRYGREIENEAHDHPLTTDDDYED